MRLPIPRLEDQQTSAGYSSPRLIRYVTSSHPLPERSRCRMSSGDALRSVCHGAASGRLIDHFEDNACEEGRPRLVPGTLGQPPTPRSRPCGLASCPKAPEERSSETGCAAWPSPDTTPPDPKAPSDTKGNLRVRAADRGRGDRTMASICRDRGGVTSREVIVPTARARPQCRICRQAMATASTARCIASQATRVQTAAAARPVGRHARGRAH